MGEGRIRGKEKGGEGKGWEKRTGEVVEYTQPPQYLWEASSMFFFSTCSLNLNETSLVSQMLCFCTHFPYHVSPASDYVKLKTVR